jgi:hypothetical protein
MVWKSGYPNLSGIIIFRHSLKSATVSFDNIPVDAARLQFAVEPENSTFFTKSATVRQRL